uniref:Secreted protein n=1 Tax=Oryza glaberrima TaxID=4538 RepID=I1PLC4_ORYGL
MKMAMFVQFPRWSWWLFHLHCSVSIEERTTSGTWAIQFVHGGWIPSLAFPSCSLQQLAARVVRPSRARVVHPPVARGADADAVGARAALRSEWHWHSTQEAGQARSIPPRPRTRACDSSSSRAMGRV